MLTHARLSLMQALLVVTALMLGACASNVRLDDLPPVVDKSGASTTDTASSNPGTSGNTINHNSANNLSNPNPGQGITSTSNTSGSSTTIATVQPIDIPNNQPDQALLAQRSVYFDYDSFAVKAQFAAALEAHAKYLSNTRSTKIALEGHTDERGGREYNLALGQKRALAVQQALLLLGVADTQIEAVSFGKEKPKAPGSTEADHAENRRVDVQYK